MKGEVQVKGVTRAKGGEVEGEADAAFVIAAALEQFVGRGGQRFEAKLHASDYYRRYCARLTWD